MGLNEKFFKSAETGGGSGLFNTVLYTGSGSSGTNEITGAGFEPDLIWIKRRPFSSAGNPGMVDSLRGNQVLFTNLELAQLAPSNATISMTNDGFDISTYGASWANQNNISYVAWCFKAGGAPSGSDKVSIDGTSYATMSAAGLTDGSLAIDKLSVNTSCGFSIATLDNKSPSTGKNMAHGLGVVPELIIGKPTNQVHRWIVYSKDIPATDFLTMNENYAKQTASFWGNTRPTNSLINFAWTASTYDYVFYSFASVAGVSKVGSYTGGSGATVNTGFEPSWVMIKRTNSTSDWFIYDNVRGEDEYLLANTNGAENTLDNVDFTGTGFNLKASNASLNVTGGTYIYYAIA